MLGEVWKGKMWGEVWGCLEVLGKVGKVCWGEGKVWEDMWGSLGKGVGKCVGV